MSLTGCITHMEVVKVTPNNDASVEGERVMLPVPFIVGTPTPDGTIKYAVQYFPDPDQEYAVQTWSFMAKQKTDISRTAEMYVQKMNLAQDSTAVATQLANSSGDVGSAALTALVSSEQAKASALAATKPTSAADAPQPTAMPEAKGIVIYRIVEDTNTGIKLERVNFKLFNFNGHVLQSDKQIDFETWGTKPKGGASVSPSTHKITPDIKGLAVNTATPSTLSQTVTFDAPITNIDSSLKNASGTIVTGYVTVIPNDAKTGVSVTFTSTISAATYSLALHVTFSDGTVGDFTIPVAVQGN
jgi:hypothetical protein